MAKKRKHADPPPELSACDGKKKRQRSDNKQSPPKAAASSNWMLLQATLGKSSGASSRKKMRETETAIDVSAATGDGVSSSKLLPTSDDMSLTQALALDCEMVGVGYEGKRNALARVSLVNQWGNLVYDKHVRPQEHVRDFRMCCVVMEDLDLFDIWHLYILAAKFRKENITRLRMQGRQWLCTNV